MRNFVLLDYYISAKMQSWIMIFHLNGYDNPKVQNYAILGYHSFIKSYGNPKVQNFALSDYHIFKIIRNCKKILQFWVIIEKNLDKVPLP